MHEPEATIYFIMAPGESYRDVTRSDNLAQLEADRLVRTRATAAILYPAFAAFGWREAPLLPVNHGLLMMGVRVMLPCTCERCPTGIPLVKNTRGLDLGSCALLQGSVGKSASLCLK